MSPSTTPAKLLRCNLQSFRALCHQRAKHGADEDDPSSKDWWSASSSSFCRGRGQATQDRDACLQCLRSLADVELLSSGFLLRQLHRLRLLAVEEAVPRLGPVRPEHGDRADGADGRDADKNLYSIVTAVSGVQSFPGRGGGGNVNYCLSRVAVAAKKRSAIPGPVIGR